MTMNSRQLRAARRDKLMRRYASKAEPMFGVESAAEQQKRLTLKAFDALESDDRAARRDQAQLVRDAARSAL
jgi:hypothetical protein